MVYRFEICFFQQPDCKCANWKASEEPNDDFECANCSHAHCTDIDSSELSNWIESIGVQLVEDIETLFILCSSEEDIETRQLFFCMLKRLRKALVGRTDPQIDDLPPFERPSINTAVRNLIIRRLSTNPNDSRMYLDVGRLVLTFLNGHRLQAPKHRKQKNENLTGYRLIYMRWMCHCYVPLFCTCFPYFDPSAAFGKNFFLALLPELKSDLVERLNNEKAKLQSELTSFISELEREARLPNSPIWDPFFRPFSASGKLEESGILANPSAVFVDCKLANESSDFNETTLKLEDDATPRRRSSKCFSHHFTTLHPSRRSYQEPGHGGQSNAPLPDEEPLEADSTQHTPRGNPSAT